MNSVEGDAQLMREELKTAKDVTIRVRRAEVGIVSERVHASFMHPFHTVPCTPLRYS